MVTRKQVEMPEIAAWIETLREAFGREEIDRQIRRGRDGVPVFFAREGGYTYGTPIPRGDPWDAAGVDDRMSVSRPAAPVAERKTRQRP
jgi:hypothetical protein